MLSKKKASLPSNDFIEAGSVDNVDIVSRLRDSQFQEASPADVINQLQNTKAYNEKQDGDHNRKLRVNLQWCLIILLFMEIVFLFGMILLQGLGIFKLNEWTFGIFINGCLAQTFLLVKPICGNLFPSRSQCRKD